MSSFNQALVVGALYTSTALGAAIPDPIAIPDPVAIPDPQGIVPFSWPCVSGDAQINYVVKTKELQTGKPITGDFTVKGGMLASIVIPAPFTTAFLYLPETHTDRMLHRGFTGRRVILLRRHYRDLGYRRQRYKDSRVGPGLFAREQCNQFTYTNWHCALPGRRLVLVRSSLCDRKSNRQRTHILTCHSLRNWSILP